MVKLRADLLANRFMPGERLTLDLLKSVYAAGFTPLREALMRLAADGLVTREGNKGFRVAPVSEEDLRDVVTTRQRIEDLVLRDAIRHGDASWEAGIVSAFHLLSKTACVDPHTGGCSELWSLHHRAFHYALIAAAPSQLLKQFWTVSFDQADRYRRLAAFTRDPRNYNSEHAEMMEAAIKRKADRACALSRKHAEQTFDVIMLMRLSSKQQPKPPRVKQLQLASKLGRGNHGRPRAAWSSRS